MLEFVGRGPVKPISLFFSLNGEWPTLSLNLVNDRIYRYELSAIWWVRSNKGEGYGKDEVMKEEVIASSNDLSRSIGSYRIHVLGLSKNILFAKRI